jgi:P-type conjugative transfer protein TrbJ
MKIKHIAVIVATICSISCVPAYATAIVGATFPQQVLQEGTALQQQATLVQQKLYEAQQLQQQIQMYQNMTTNTAQIPSQLWNNMSQPLAQLAQLVGQGQAISLNGQNIGSQFQNMYTGFSAQNTNAQYQNWGQSNLDQINGALQSQGLAVTQFQNMAQATQTIQNEPASGRAGLLNVGNQIAGQEVSGLQTLGTMVAAQQHAQDAYMAYQVKSSGDNNAQLNTWVNSTANGAGNGLFGVVP